MKYNLFYQDDKSNKFWTIQLVGKTYKSTNGRVGSSPRETIKEFSTIEEAKKAIEKQVKAKLKKGYQEGEVPKYEKTDWTSITMNEDLFWRIIKLLNWKKTGDDDLVIKPCIDVLKQMPIENSYKFEDILSKLLYQLDTKAHAKEIGEDAYKEGEYFSPDNFLYARCVPIANGEKCYNNVLKNPKEFPKDLEFEALLSIASEAYEQKTNQEWDYNCDAYSYETYENTKGWLN